MSPETSAVTQLLLRFFHILFGVVWLGHLYFFNFVNGPFQAVLDKELKPRVNPPLLLRALYWFRWGAVFTLLTGWVLFGLLYWPFGAALLPPEGGLSARGVWMLIGAVLGTVMFANVWLVIWPVQKKILGGLAAGSPAPPELAARVTLVSRINLFLSAPMLMGMVAGSHHEVWALMPGWMHGVFLILTLGGVHGLWKRAQKAGGSL
ncbi:MAG TPA: urate hydroxylase PuuD [Vicinamibacteria bacterium]|nr:urate hydroxylase PuuD [Vicinamibacteria bacterium]